MRFDGTGPAGRPLKPRPRARPADTTLVETAFAPNPGNLRLFTQGLAPGAPLVVLLHGCGQAAAGFAQATGWSALAAEQGFALAVAEQKAVNNPHTCFNWFNPEDIVRDGGEAASIAAMVRTCVDGHGLDAGKVFICGLSAGGAMTATMLALYPELFAGGAIIAGLPFGTAANVRDALDAMRMPPLKTPRQWGDLVRGVARHDGAWPRLSVWHGDRDTTVNILNAQALVAQWSDLHGLALTAARQDFRDGAMHLSWGDTLEVVTVPGLGHGVPIDARDVGTAAPYILDVGLSSARRIAGFWGLIPAQAAETPQPVVTEVPPALAEIEAVLAPMAHEAAAAAERAEGMIRRALRAAGLLKDG